MTLCGSGLCLKLNVVGAIIRFVLGACKVKSQKRVPYSNTRMCAVTTSIVSYLFNTFGTRTFSYARVIRCLPYTTLVSGRCSRNFTPRRSYASQVKLRGEETRESHNVLESSSVPTAVPSHHMEWGAHTMNRMGPGVRTHPEGGHGVA